MKIIKTISYLLIVFCMLDSSLTHVYAGGSFCDPAHNRKIPPLGETECNAVLYSMFPKITEYKGQLWEAGPSCSYNGAPSQSDLRVQYCKSGHTQGKDSTGKTSGENLDFKTTILDMEGPQYTSKTSQSLLKGSMPFSMELDITSTDELARQPSASQAAAGWRANA